MKSERVAQLSAPFGKNGFTSLSIRVDHAGNGYNYFHGNRYTAGHRLYLTPCTISEGIRSSVLMSGDQWESGFYIKLDDAARKNPHYIKRVLATLDVTAHVGIIREAFEKKDIETLKQCGIELHTAAYKAPKAVAMPALATV